MPTTETAEKTSLEIQEILNILPHRYPFLLVDRIVEINKKENYILGQKNLTMNEPFFQGHFPGRPVMPGVLVIEALGQTGAVFVHMMQEKKDSLSLLTSIKNAKFRLPVVPGDILMLKCEGGHFGSKGGRVHAVATVNGKLAAEADIGYVLVKK